MALRLYLSANSGGTAFSPTFASGWEVTTSAQRRLMHMVKDGSTIASKTSPAVGGVAVRDVLQCQFISALPLKAQTISGNITMQLRGNINVSTSSQAKMTIVARVISPGGTVRGTLIDTTGTGIGTDYTTTLTNRQMVSTAITSVAALDGDYLVIEVGWTYTSGTTTTRTVTQSFGSSSATDLAQDSSTTTANNPWIEFSANIGFLISSNITATSTVSAAAINGNTTKYYISSTAIAAVSPAFASGWNVTTGADRMDMSTTKDGSAFTNKNSGNASGTSPKLLLRQGVSGQISAQTINGDISFSIMEKYNTAFQALSYIIIRIVSADGSTFRGTVLDTSGQVFNLDSSFAERGGSAYTATSVVAQNGDRIVVELGAWVTGTVSGSDFATAEFGSAGADLPGDFSGSTGQSSWVQFGQGITPFSSGSSISAAITAGASVATAIGGVGAVSAPIAPSASVVTAIKGVGAVSVAITPSSVLSASAISVRYAVSSIAASAAVSASLLGNGFMVAQITPQALLSASILGTSSIASAILASSSLSVSILGVSSLSASLSGASSINASILGIGSISAGATPFISISVAIQDNGTPVSYISVGISASALVSASIIGNGIVSSNISDTAIVNASGLSVGAIQSIVSTIADLEARAIGYGYVAIAITAPSTAFVQGTAVVYAQSDVAPTAILSASIRGIGYLSTSINIIAQLEARISNNTSVVEIVNLNSYVTPELFVNSKITTGIDVDSHITNFALINSLVTFAVDRDSYISSEALKSSIIL